ncbi:hypothetical protein GGF46_002446 [Coemansia sp. RSA 552]|nr:hypothetical protein GGF46_002446 [Coemansia sp. RSA 552]
MSAAKKSRWEVDDDDDEEGAVGRPKRTKRSQPDAGHGTVEGEERESSPVAPSPRPDPPAILPTHLGQEWGQLSGCRQIDQCYERLNKIEEGTYGIVYRARDLVTGEVVALKHLKLEKERGGFPITALREIHTLQLAKHPNIINVREIAVGRSLNSIYMVMDFMEHDLRSLMETMPEPFRPSEVKALMWQLCSAVAHLHQNWVVHRDLKTSNLLMASGGALRVADFGLARKYSSPLGHMTGLVVTLWYRAPELLMGEKEYSTMVDMWSVGCIFAELFLHRPLFQGRGEIDQITRIFAACGTPDSRSWPGFAALPNARVFKFSSKTDPSKRLPVVVGRCKGMTDCALDLLSRLLALDPQQRISASQALDHPYFAEHPPPKHPHLFPTWPSKAT